MIKQVGKQALMNSARGAIWEQKNIDKLFPDPNTFFTNPVTEANKFKVLREVMIEERAVNNKAIVSAISPKEIDKLRTANTDINRLLSLIGETPSMLSAEDEALINKYLDTGD